jgi:hypothetical protein
MTDVFVSELRWMAEILNVVLVLTLSLNIHVACVPIALFGHGLRTPVRPDSELRVAKPIGATVLLQRLPEWQERTVWDLSAKERRLPKGL